MRLCTVQLEGSLVSDDIEEGGPQNSISSWGQVKSQEPRTLEVEVLWYDLVLAQKLPRRDVGRA